MCVVAMKRGGAAPKRRCTNVGCGKPDNSLMYMTVDGRSTTGGQDWRPLAGRVLCQSCYNHFRRNGSLKVDEGCAALPQKDAARKSGSGGGYEHGEGSSAAAQGGNVSEAGKAEKSERAGRAIPPKRKAMESESAGDGKDIGKRTRVLGKKTAGPSTRPPGVERIVGEISEGSYAAAVMSKPPPVQAPASNNVKAPESVSEEAEDVAAEQVPAGQEEEEEEEACKGGAEAKEGSEEGAKESDGAESGPEGDKAAKAAASETGEALVTPQKPNDGRPLTEDEFCAVALLESMRKVSKKVDRGIKKKKKVKASTTAGEPEAVEEKDSDFHMLVTVQEEKKNGGKSTKVAKQIAKEKQAWLDQAVIKPCLPAWLMSEPPESESTAQLNAKSPVKEDDSHAPTYGEMLSSKKRPRPTEECYRRNAKYRLQDPSGNVIRENLPQVA